MQNITKNIDFFRLFDVLSEEEVYYKENPAPSALATGNSSLTWNDLLLCAEQEHGCPLHHNRSRLAMTDILSGLRNGQSAVVVSHAAAICAYLMEFASCEVTVMDADTKSRKVVFHGKKIHEGPIPAPSYFVMMFEDRELADLDYHAR